MKSLKIYWFAVTVLFILGCQFTNTFMATRPTATPVRARTRTPTPALQTLPPPPTVAVVPPVPVPTEPPAPVTGTAKDNLRVRAAPSTSGAIVGRLNKGDQAQIVARTEASDWFQIILPADPNARGWVSAEFMAVAVPADSIPIGTAEGPSGGGQVTPPPRPYP